MKIRKDHRDTAISWGALSAIGALVPFVDAPLVAEIAGPIAFGAAWMAQSIIRHPYLPLVKHDGNKTITVGLARRPWRRFTPVQLQAGGRGGRANEDVWWLQIGVVNIDDVNADEKLAELIAKTKSLISASAEQKNEINRVATRTQRLLDKR